MISSIANPNILLILGKNELLIVDITTITPQYLSHIDLLKLAYKYTDVILGAKTINLIYNTVE